MQKAKDEIERTKKIMEDNIRNVAERGDRLDSLRDKTGELALIWRRGVLFALETFDFRYHH